ncbi:MAG: hypothetical protein AB7K24_19395 [Gemmataceae bacterium]
MKRTTTTLAVLGLLLVAGQLQAKIAGPDPLFFRVGKADVIVVGTVSSYEEKAVAARRNPTDKDPVDHQVMLVKVGERLKGGDGLTHVRVAFVPVNSTRHPQLAPLAVGTRACFFLRRHFKEDFYVAQPYYDTVAETKNEPLDKPLEAVKRMTKVAQRPGEALKSKDAQERFLAATMLIAQYRGTHFAGRPANATRTEPIDAAQSKLILEALLAADWQQHDFDQPAPLTVFLWLGLTGKDGWKIMNGANVEVYEKQAKKWLQDHAGTYRIAKFVP